MLHPTVVLKGKFLKFEKNCLYLSEHNIYMKQNLFQSVFWEKKSQLLSLGENFWFLEADWEATRVNCKLLLFIEVGEPRYFSSNSALEIKMCLLSSDCK